MKNQTMQLFFSTKSPARILVTAILVLAVDTFSVAKALPAPAKQLTQQAPKTKFTSNNSGSKNVEEEQSITYADYSKKQSQQIAVGLLLGLQQRADFGSDIHSKVHPEIFAYHYFYSGVSQLWLRSGVGVSYVNDQPEMPKALKILEKDVTFFGQASTVFDWYVSPSLGAGFGMIYRTISSQTTEPIVAGNPISLSERLQVYHLQAGLGFSFHEGFFLAEPFYRKYWVLKDARIKDLYGIELSLRVW